MQGGLPSQLLHLGHGGDFCGERVGLHPISQKGRGSDTRRWKRRIRGLAAGGGHCMKEPKEGFD